MTGWTPAELAGIGAADELRIASYRGDGTLRPSVIIWVVRVDDELYVRSAHGSGNPWYVRAIRSGRGRISAAGIDREVDFVPADPQTNPVIDAAYHAKYDRYGPRIVGTVVGDHAHDVTLRLVPRPH